MMEDPSCFFDASDDAPEHDGHIIHRLHALRPEGMSAFLERLAPAARNYIRFVNFSATADSIAILPPGEDGVIDAVLGLGDDQSHAPYGALPFGLPAESHWRLVGSRAAAEQTMLGFGLGAYRFQALKTAEKKPARLARLPGTQNTVSCIKAIWMGRDLINRPANLLGPAELAHIILSLAERFSGAATIVEGNELEEAYPTVAAVGRGSERAPRVATLRWRGSRVDDSSPLVSLCGKGVCFDSGGYDLKPSAGMLRMKKDMGGAAAMMALAAMVMAEDLPVRLILRVGCVENSVSGRAMRPSDIIRTRSGRTVEIGNTDAEGRLVLCDLLYEAAAETPDVLIDAATLTGAARAALGPELPALFCNDPAWSLRLLEAGRASHDPVWELPLWSGYDNWLDSNVADLNNVSTKGFAGAIVAALFLQRFIAGAKSWIHFDLYAWNDQTRPAAPEGGEIQAVRAAFLSLRRQYGGANVESKQAEM